MRMIIRGILAALAAALLIAVFAVVPVQAETWSSAVTSGYTSVHSTFVNGKYTWTLTNNSPLIADTSPSFEVLLWSLKPYQVNEPIAVDTPDGWIWDGDSWSVAASNKKYYTPFAVAPGKNVTFGYTVDPNADLINNNGPQPLGLNFTVHVGAVVPNSGSTDGLVKWQVAPNLLGDTWYDRPNIGTYVNTMVPEPLGILTLVCGLAMLALFRLRRMISRQSA